MPVNMDPYLLSPYSFIKPDDGRKFKFHMDDYFTMGSSHHVCEDYTRVFEEIDGSGIVVSDGCSSSIDTDFGSRFMALSAIKHATVFSNLRVTPQMLMSMAIQYLSSPLKTECLDATLMLARPLKTGYVSVQVFGDGVVAVRRRNGSLEHYVIDQGGAPSYPSYFTNPGRMEALKKAGYGFRKITVFVDGEQKTTWEWTPDELETCPDFSFLVDPADTDLVVLMTDGVQSFQDINGTAPVPVPLEEVLPHVVGFKNQVGAFVGRRINALEKRECPKLGWQHHDDLGVAAIYIEETTEKEES